MCSCKWLKVVIHIIKWYVFALENPYLEALYTIIAHISLINFKVNPIFEQALEDFSRVTGRKYKIFEYHYFGTTKPRICIVTMGSSVEVVKEVLKHIKSEQVCLVGVRLFRPWSAKTFCNSLPQSVHRIATLDRTKESGAQGEPLYLDVCASLMSCKRDDIFVAGGRYGLASKDFSPRMVMSVINNMMRTDANTIQHPFTVGIVDDVTHLSLPLGKEVTALPDGVTQCVFWGFGSDGTVVSNANFCIGILLVDECLYALLTANITYGLIFSFLSLSGCQ